MLETAQNISRPQPRRRSLWLASLALRSSQTVGGQAVMEGVMMRNKDKLAVAVRKTDGAIHVEIWPWFSLTRAAWLKKPFVRGFPVLLETLVNGIKALNFSASQAAEDQTDSELKPWHLVLTMCMAVAAALGLFVVVPHFFSLGMKGLGFGGDVEGLSFHIWDGFFKLAIFLGYIGLISLIPDIRRVFEYHGAEHKVIWAYESEGEFDPARAKGFSRLHPRCGTTFLLFVLSISIVIHAFLVPLILTFHTPGNAVVKHAYILTLKIFLVAPISAAAYEAIKFAGARAGNFFCRLMSGPGLLLQMLTTREPDEKQLEVAGAALKGALGRTAEGPGAAGENTKPLNGLEVL